MSAAAEAYVAMCTHPKVKGGARDVFEAIARLIPEGHTTTTPPVGMGELATKARLHRVTVVSRVKVLVEIGEVEVVDGGQGRAGARYTIVHLNGERPRVAAPLPLRADLQPVRPCVAREATPDLFDPVVEPMGGEESAINLLRSATSTPRQLVAIGYKWVRRIAYLLRSTTSWPFNLLRSATSAPPLDIDDARARDVRTHLKEVHTHAPPADEPPSAAPHFVGDGCLPREVAAGTEPLSSRGVGASSVGAAAGKRACRLTGTVHAWCDGRVHVPTLLHEELLRKHGRAEGEGERDVETKLFAFYAERDAELSPGESIGENEFQFWRRSYAAKVRGTPPRDRRAIPLGEVVGADVWSEILRHVETKVNRHSFCTWWADSVLIGERPGAIDVAMKTPEQTVWVQKHYQRVLEEAIAEVRPGLSVRFVDPPAAAAPRSARGAS